VVPGSRNSGRVFPVGGIRAVLTVASLVASAYLLSLVLASPASWWLGAVTLLPLFYSIRALSQLAAGCAGAVWGLSLFAFSTQVFDTGVQSDLASLLLLALIPAAYAGAGVWLTRRVGFSPYLLALGWIGVEFALRPVGLNYGLLAATQGDGFAINVVGSYAGYVFIAFAVAYFNALLFSVLIELPVFRGSDRRIVSASTSGLRIFSGQTIVQPAFAVGPTRPRAPPSLA